jgi:hypothetical protein
VTASLGRQHSLENGDIAQQSPGHRTESHFTHCYLPKVAEEEDYGKEQWRNPVLPEVRSRSGLPPPVRLVNRLLQKLQIFERTATHSTSTRAPSARPLAPNAERAGYGGLKKVL